MKALALYVIILGGLGYALLGIASDATETRASKIESSLTVAGA
jgi:hypothetical protein